MKLIITYFCSHTFKDKEIIVENVAHIPRIGETVKGEAVLNHSGRFYWPKLKVANVLYEFDDNIVRAYLD